MLSRQTLANFTPRQTQVNSDGNQIETTHEFDTSIGEMVRESTETDKMTESINGRRD